jgi:two-component system sensor histidine kinase DesK
MGREPIGRRLGTAVIPVTLAQREAVAAGGVPADVEEAELEANQRFMTRLQGSWRLFFVSVWLGYLVPTLQRAANAPELGWRVVGVVAVLAFCMLYLGVFVVVRRIRVSLAAAPSPIWPWFLVSLAVALILLAAPAAGETVLAMCIYLAVMVMFVLPTRAAVVVVLLDAATVALLSNLVPGWDSENLLSFQILVVALAIWGIIQLLQRNNQLAQAREVITGLAVSQERLRFSRDLHDILGHSLTVITLKSELAGRLVRIDPERAEREIAEVERLARAALADVRATAAGYRDISLAVELASARTALDAAGIEADLAGTVDDVPSERLELFGWAVREGVTNVVRHSGARHCRVTVDRRVVEITDDGRGPGRCEDEPAVGATHTFDRSSIGNGLAGLRERAAAVGATVSVGRSLEGGFRLRVAW